jgi:hypothetical protein
MGLMHKIARVKKLVGEFMVLTNPQQQTYFPEAPRKSKAKIIGENLMWVLKHGEINRHYYMYGLDRKDVDRTQEVLAYKEFTRIRDSRNLRVKGNNFNYAAVLRDKFVAGQFFTSIGVRSPKNIALIDKQTITWLDTMRVEDLNSITANKDLYVDGFCKQLAGLQGTGAFLLKMENGNLYVQNKPTSVSEFIKLIKGPYILQERIIQHESFNVVYADAINTLRIVTFNRNGNIEVFYAAMRVGAGRSTIDNWSSGGIAIGIDLETGLLKKYGYFKPKYGRRVEVHPDSGLRFENFPVPFLKESIELVTSTHRYLYGIHSIGWDVAIDRDGPLIIEANEDWGGGFAMASIPNFKGRFLNMFSDK